MNEGAGKMQVQNCNIHGFDFAISVGNQPIQYLSTLTVLHLDINGIQAISSYITVNAKGYYSFVSVSITNSEMHGFVFHATKEIRSVGIVVENCTLSTNDMYPVGVYIENAVYVKVTKCTFTDITDDFCVYGCPIYIEGKVKPAHLEKLVQSLTCPVSKCTLGEVFFEQTLFEGSLNFTGSAIYCRSISLRIINSQFNIHISNYGHFIHYFDTEYSTFKAANITLNLTDPTKAITALTITSDIGMEFKNVTLVCSKGMQGREHVRTKSGRLYTCQEGCSKDSYTFQQGSMLIHGLFRKWDYYYNISVSKSPLNCFPCPVGANCEHLIDALPNYWGYNNQSGYVTMLRCPAGYCCSANETCKGIDSCNTGRTGTLCGTCATNFAECLFSTKCIPLEDCRSYLVIALYTICAILYAMFLLIISCLKDKILNKLTEVYKALKNRIKPKDKNNTSIEEPGDIINETLEVIPSTSQEAESKGNTNSKASENQEKIENKGTESLQAESSNGKDSGMKYIQILFYYVQDSSLFHVHLPEQTQQSEELIVKILQFSPEIIVILHGKVSDMCFTHGTTAVSKVLLKSLFGPYVMCLFLLVYLVQKQLSRYLHPKSPLWKSLRAGLTQAFLMAFLFSYQQIVTGAFSLVQCVEVRNQAVLYVQGNIECYAWWQVLIQVYTWLNIVPIFLVLSHAPYHVQDKTLSVKTFILACIFPVPVMGYFLGRILLQNIRRKIGSRDDTETCIGMSELSPKLHTEVKPYTGPGDEIIHFIDEISDLDSSEGLSIHDQTSEQEQPISHDSIHAGSTPQTLNADKASQTKDLSVKTGNDKDSRKAILHTLVEHYRCMRIFGIRFTWMGIHKLYRLLLVVSNTYITEPVPRLLTMTSGLMVIAVANTLLKPYADNRANITAILSYAANLCIAMLNLWKTALATFDCKTNCSMKEDLLRYFEVFEKVFLIYLPFVIFVLWAICTGIQKCRSKPKTE